MQKFTCLGAFLVAFIGQLFAQKHDYLWFSGDNGSITDTCFLGNILDFHTSPATVTQEARELSFYITNATSCDSSGQLLFYSNGTEIRDKVDQKMPNGQGLNPDGLMMIDPSWASWGYPLLQSALAIPNPGHTDQYRIIHGSADYLPTGLAMNFLLSTTIDMKLNNGLGAVIQKNEPIVEDSMFTISAVKHSNARDWWIIVFRKKFDVYIRALITPDGIQGPYFQEFAPLTPDEFDFGGGQTNFSPDGTKYVRFDAWDGLRLFDFDRCTGLLSNPKVMPITEHISFGAGATFSPNSRYLYFDSSIHLFQLDTWAADPFLKIDTVGFYDGFANPLPTTFFYMQQGPDDKIYMISPNGVKSMHVINQPDSAGVACDFQQHSLHFMNYISATIPTNPNYRLGPSPDSCDMSWLAAREPDASVQFLVFPNPSAGQLTFLASEEVGGPLRFELFNALGQRVFLKNDFQLNEPTDLSGLPSGCFFWKISLQSGRMRTGKLILKRG